MRLNQFKPDLSAVNKLNTLLLFLFVFNLQGFSEDYFVSKKGHNNNPGTKRQPFLTIQHAANIMNAGDVCYITEGTYSEVVTPKYSGTPKKPIIFRPLNNDNVTITGADNIPVNDWELVSGNIYKCKIKLELDHENQVFLNNTTMIPARWPNVGKDLFKPGLAVMDEGTTTELIVDSDLPDFDLTGAHVWIHAPKFWSDWTTKIIGKEPGQSFKIENIAPYPGPSQHVTKEGADYFIFYCKDALDAENEWFYDEQTTELFLFCKGNPGNRNYSVKKRMNAFDLENRKNIVIEGVTIHGASINTNHSSKNILLDRVNILYPYFSSQANKYYGTQTSKGVLFSGKNCTIQNSELAYSSGCGVILDGENNKVLNCYIHDTDFIGTYASCVQLKGKGNIISHCTLTRSGRTVIDYGAMYQSLIQFCDMSHSGLLTSDLGLTYGNVIEGGNSEVRYNLMHDNDDTHLDMGLYYDHGTQNIISHHNIVWGVGYSGFQVNHYAAYHLVYHNTFISDTHGFRSNWGNKYSPDLLGCRWVNNIFSGRSETSAGNYYWSNNLTMYDKFSSDNVFKLPEEAKQYGILVKNISIQKDDSQPSIGAIEYEGMNWIAGHDFENYPEYDFTRSLPLHRNLIRNSAFEHENNLWPWVASSEGVKLISHPHKNHTRADTAVGRMGNHSIELLEKGAEIFQTMKGLIDNSEYTFTGHVRVESGESVVLGIRYPDGTTFLSPRVTAGAPAWRRINLNFTTLNQQHKIEVFVRRISGGNGTIHIDDFGLIKQ